jgi:hypothetical protein
MTDIDLSANIFQKIEEDKKKYKESFKRNKLSGSKHCFALYLIVSTQVHGYTTQRMNMKERLAVYHRERHGYHDI